jgi:hypothetical protein
MGKVIAAMCTQLVLALTFGVGAFAQGTLGSITGTVTDSSGAVVADAEVKIHNLGTGQDQTANTKKDGSFSVEELPIGAYSVTFSRDGFKTEVHSRILVQGDRTTTVNSTLVPGEVSATVTVTGTPLMNQTDTTIGYVVDSLTVENTPLGTGSFTQLAILSPGVHADFLGGAGSNAGLGNQAIFADGNRDTSNSFSLNGVSTNNLFNGNSASQVGENRFVLNTGENFGAGGQIQTSTSVYSAIGQALPTPPPDAIQEISVNAAMYDATQGNNSGAHIGVVTKSGTNDLHGSVWEEFQNSDMNATPFFYNAAGKDPTTGQQLLPKPFLNRNAFGGTLGGPILKDRLFFFASYQGVRIADAESSTKDVSVPFFLTNDRSATGITNTMIAEQNYQNTQAENPLCGPGQTPPDPCFQASQINQAAMNLLNAKLPNGQYLIPTPAATFTSQGPTAGPAAANALGYDAVVQGPNTQAQVNQGIAGVDYAVNDKDHLSAKYYVQSDPTTNPFGSAGVLLGFPQQLAAGSQVISIGNSVVLTPNLTWEQHVGFTRLKAYAAAQEAFSAGAEGISLFGGASFPDISISTSSPETGAGMEFGPAASFANAGLYQNDWSYGSTLNLVKGKHVISVGAQWDHTQLNVINNNTNTDTLDFQTFQDFVEGTLHGGDEFAGSADRYYRADTVGLFANDNWKVRSNLTVTLGLRWDFDGPLSEKYGRLTGFDPSLYSYDATTDTITGSGLVIAGNNKTAGTPGASDTLMKNHQYGFAPRIGMAWSPLKKITLRAGYGIYYDRGEYFSYLSPSAGSGFNGPFGVTLAPPFVSPVTTAQGATLSAPFGTIAPPAPPATATGFLAYLPNLSQTACGYPGCWPTGNQFGPFLFGGYDIYNKLPYTQNWTLDVQFQASNNWMFEIGYVGNHGNHEVLPIAFNQPQIATPTNPVNGQTYSYGGTSPLANQNYYGGVPLPLDSEPVYTNEYAGNAPLRVKYVGYDMNSVLYEAEGVSNYNALQAQVHKRLSMGLQLTASYTWSHTLDEQSGLGLFFTGNNPLNPRSGYASADFDQTHVFLVNYSYTTPNLAKDEALGRWVNGWIIAGQTVAQSGEPYSVYDYSGSVASLYYGTSNYIGNPIVPLLPGVTANQAKLQGTLGVNPGKPVLNVADFGPQFVAPGTDGVPPCDATGCDYFESVYGNTGRNIFRGPFQVRFDMSLAKDFAIKERFHLRFEADAFNIFNHPDFDTPNNDVDFFPNYEGPASVPPEGSLGYIQHTIGSPRFLQLKLHLTF